MKLPVILALLGNTQAALITEGCIEIVNAETILDGCTCDESC